MWAWTSDTRWFRMAVTAVSSKIGAATGRCSRFPRLPPALTSRVSRISKRGGAVEVGVVPATADVQCVVEQLGLRDGGAVSLAAHDLSVGL